MLDRTRHGGARLSECGRYRYSLWRVWDAGLPSLAWCLLNPSTADAEREDATTRRLRGFCRAWGYGGYLLVNLFALRATDPARDDHHGHLDRQDR